MTAPYKAAPATHLIRAYRFLGLLAMALLWFLPIGRAGAQETPTLRQHVTDAAGVLGDRTAAITAKLLAFERETGNQVFVLMVPTTAGQSIEEYTVQVFQKSKIGQRKLDNGVLFVIAMADRKMRIEVGYGLEGVLTDARSSRILRNVVLPQFKEGRIAAGIEAGVDQILANISPSTANVLSDTPLPVTLASEQITKRRFGHPEVVFLGVLFTIFWTMSLWLGGALLALATIPIAMFARSHFPGTFTGAFGWWALSAILLPWFYLRWKVIAEPVRKHRLPRSTCRLCTWFWAFGFVPLGVTFVRQRRGRDSGSDFAFSWSSDSDSGSSSSSDSGGGGGESGGGGASDSW